MGVAVMANFRSRGRDLRGTAWGQVSMAWPGMQNVPPDFVLVEEAHQARHPNLGAELATRHVGG